MKMMMVLGYLVLFLVSITLIRCSTTPSGEIDGELKEFSTPAGDIKVTLDPLTGYTYSDYRNGISFSLRNPKRFNLWAKDLEDYPTGSGRAFKYGAPGQRGWKWGTDGIAFIHDSYDTANMYMHIMKKVDDHEMEKLIDAWHEKYHRISPAKTQKIREDLKLPNGIQWRKIQYLFTTTGGSEGEFQAAYLEIPNNRYFVVRVWHYKTYGKNTKEMLDLIKSVQILKIHTSE